jgi:hypothetical protein
VEKLVLVQCWIRRKQRLWSALGNSLMTQRPYLRRRLYETEQVRDVDTRARSSASVLAPQRVDQAVGSRSFFETERGRGGCARGRSSGDGYGPQRVVQAIGARHLSETERGRDGDTRTRSSAIVLLAPQRVDQAIGSRSFCVTERGRDGFARASSSGVGHGPQMVVQAIGALPRVRERIPAWKSSPAWQ